jgi:DNA-binding transcriptional LysR family regulator
MLAFLRVAELGSFVLASESLGLSKAAVSKQVSALERRLGTRLLHRTTRRLSLTEAGQAYLRHAQTALAEAHAAEDAVADSKDVPHGRLRLSVPTTFGLLHVAPWLHLFLGRYPQVSLEAHYDDHMRDLVTEGLDIAIRIGQLRKSNLIARKLATSRVLLCAAPAYLDAHGRPARPDDTALHECLHYSLAAEGRSWELTRSGETVRVALNVRVSADSSLALKAVTLAGGGIARIPEFAIADELRTGSLEVVLPEWRLPSLEIYAVMPERHYVPPKVRAFVNFLSSCWAARPGWIRGEI